MKHSLLLAALLPALLTGCAGMSGLSGSTSHLACHAPKGVLCSSISGVYANSVAGTLPSQQVNHGGDLLRPQSLPPADQSAPDRAAPDSTAAPAYPVPSGYVKAPESGAPILSPPQVLRVWIAPWKDPDGDLRDQQYLYVLWDRGHWEIDHTEHHILREYAPVRPLTPLPGASSSAASPATIAAEAAGQPSGVPGVPNPVAAAVPQLPGTGPKSLDAGDTP